MAKQAIKEWGRIHHHILRFTQGRKKDRTWPAGLLAARDLENDGLLTIHSVSPWYQDPGATPEEGEVPIADIEMSLTAAGRALAKRLKGRGRRQANPKKSAKRKPTIAVRLTDAMARHIELGHLEGVQEKYPDTRIEGSRLIGSRDALRSLYSSVMEHARLLWEEKSLGRRAAGTVIALRDRLESATGDVIPEEERMGWYGVVRDHRLMHPKKPKRSAPKKNPDAKAILRSAMRGT